MYIISFDYSVKIRYKCSCGVARGSDGWAKSDGWMELCRGSDGWEFYRGVGRGVGNLIDGWEVE